MNDIKLNMMISISFVRLFSLVTITTIFVSQLGYRIKSNNFKMLIFAMYIMTMAYIVAILGVIINLKA